MCGFIALAGSIAHGPISHRVLGRLRRRGPDGQGFWVGRNVVLAHARLDVIAPGDEGLQPVEYFNWALAFNGEIYNWMQLRKRGERTDSAVLLRMFAESGVEALKQLHGFWAFAAVDGIGRVHLVRDQLGIRPLYYARTGSGLVAASTLRAVVENLPQRPSYDDEAMSEWARYQLVFGDHTFFRGVKRVMPGHAVVYDPKSNVLIDEEYEDIWRTGDVAPDEAWVMEAQEILIDSVSEATTSDVSFASTCSGGLDSSVVTRLAEPQVAYHGNYSGPEFNETQWARAVVEGTKTRLFVHNSNETPDLCSTLVDLVQDQDDLSVGSVVLPLDELMQAVKTRYSVLLLGTGGDELFGGYARLELAVGKCSQSAYFDAFQRMAHLKTVEQRYESQHAKGSGKLFKFYDDDAARHGFDSMCDWDQPRDTAMLGFERRVFLPALLTIDDRISGRHGVEGRPALLHQAFVRHVAQVSPSALLAGGLKSVARRVFESFLPRAVLMREDKKGFPTPVGAMVNANSAYIREWITSSPHSDLYDLSKVRWTTENPYDRTLFGLLQLDAWLRSW